MVFFIEKKVLGHNRFDKLMAKTVIILNSHDVFFFFVKMDIWSLHDLLSRIFAKKRCQVTALELTSDRRKKTISLSLATVYSKPQDSHYRHPPWCTPEVSSKMKVKCFIYTHIYCFYSVGSIFVNFSIITGNLIHYDKARLCIMITWQRQ